MTQQLVNDSQATSAHAVGRQRNGDRAHSHAVVLEKAFTRSMALEGALNEFCRRTQAGQRVDPDAFCREYPSILDSLPKLIEAQLLLWEHPEWFPAPWPVLGKRFLGFDMEAELGRGAFARVFLATEPALGDRRVAVKVSQGGEHEAKTIGTLAHPNVVPVYSVRYDPNTDLTAICMPYHGSATLSDVLGQVFAASPRPQSAAAILTAIAHASIGGGTQHREAGDRFPCAAAYEEGVLHLAIQLADALTFVHECGFFHRDLKPSNVLMSDAGVPMLLDFNLSQKVSAVRKQAGGTLPYMPPEQLLSLDAADESVTYGLDARSDLFSLGVMLYELLVGQHPFGPIPHRASFNDTRQLLLAHQERGATPLRQLRPDLSRGLASLVEACLRFDREDRPASARELSERVQALAHPLRRLGRRMRRNVKLLVAAGLLIGASTAAGAHLLMPTGTASERALAAGQAAFHQSKHSDAIEHFGKAIKADPAHAFAYRERGRAYQQLGKWALAKEDYDKANELQPDGRLLAASGYCLARQKPAANAIPFLTLAIKAGYGTPEVYNNLGYCNLEAGDQILAKKYLDMALSMDGKLQPAFHNRARVPLRKLGSIKGVELEALDDIRQAILLAPQPSSDLYFDGARLCATACLYDPRWIDVGIEYLREAIARGKSPAEVASDALIKRFARSQAYFDVLASTPLTVVNKAADRLIDPFAAANP